MRFIRFFAFIFFIGLSFVACKKNPAPVDVTPSFYFINGDTTGFSQNSILFASADTLSYNIVISSTYYLAKATDITVAASDGYRDSYNQSHGTNYVAMPASAYSFPTTITADVNSIFDTITVKFNKNELPAGQSYMLPIAIVKVTNYEFRPETAVIYLHIENSKLSGIYVSNGTRILYNGDAANDDIQSIDSFSIVKTLVPESPITSSLDYADLGANGWKYDIGFFASEDSLFYAVPNTTILNSVETGSFKVITNTFDPTTKDIHIKTSYKNLSGDERIVEESLTLH